MTSRELVTKTLRHEPVDRLPRDLWTVPYIPMFRGDEMERFLSMYPTDFTGASGIHYGPSHYEQGRPNRIGRYTDAFGSVWEVLEDGIIGEVKNPIIKTEADLDSYRLPWEMLDESVTSGQYAAYKETGQFVKCGSHVNPFERMQFLLGTEALYMAMATEDPLFLRLRDMLHEFNLKEFRMLAPLALDGIGFMDDWGSQRALLISPEMWRKYFKPMYREYCDIIHAAGKAVFFHSDGYTEAIYSDLIEIGVDAYNSQLFCMDLEAIGDQYAGKITFWGELDRQRILPFGTEEEVRADVRRLGKALLKQKRSGLIAQLSWETVTPMRNVIAAYDEFSKL